MTDRMTEQEIDALCEALETDQMEGWSSDVICVSGELATRALTAIRQLQQPWRGIESMGTAPRDRTHILVKTTPRDDNWAYLGGRWFVVWHVGDVSGWSLFPGFGVDDSWFEGWQPLPTPPETER